MHHLLKLKIATIVKTPGTSFSNEQRILHKNGAWRWCAGTIINLLHVHGVRAIVSNFRDISGRKSMEQQQEFYTNNLDALLNLGGTITIVSREHTGTTFTVRLKNLIDKNLTGDQPSRNIHFT